MSSQKVTPAQAGDKSDLQIAIESAHIACGRCDVRIVHSSRFSGWAVVIAAPKDGKSNTPIIQDGSDPILVLQEAVNRWQKVHGGAS